MKTGRALDFMTCARPAGDRAVKAVLEWAVDETVRAFEADGLASVILTGAMTCGEGTVRQEPDGRTTLLSDVDVYLVFRDGANLDRLRPRVSAQARELARRLPAGVSVEAFDLAAVREADLQSLPVEIGTLDLRNRGRVLWGKDVLSGLPPLDGTRVPAKDAVTLVLNRIVEELARPPGEADPRAAYHAAKTGADLALAILALLGEYRPTYRERAVRLREVWQSPQLADLRAAVPDLPERVGAWTEAKIAAGDGRAATAPAGSADLVPAVEAVWAWAIRQWTGSSQTTPEGLVGEIGRTETLREKLRGWRSARRSGAVGHGAAGLWRMAVGATRGSPKSLLYAAASLVYFSGGAGNGPVSARRLREARRLMPVPPGRRAQSIEDEREDLRLRLVEFWKTVVMRGMR